MDLLSPLRMEWKVGLTLYFLKIFFFFKILYWETLFFFQDSSAPNQGVVFNLVVGGAATWPMWGSNRQLWCYEHCVLTT